MFLSKNKYIIFYKGNRKLEMSNYTYYFEKMKETRRTKKWWLDKETLPVGQLSRNKPLEPNSIEKETVLVVVVG